MTAAYYLVALLYARNSDPLPEHTTRTKSAGNYLSLSN